MKKILGAIAAAMVWGAGCAHNQEKTAQTQVPSSPQASVESGQLGASGAPAGYQCEVISTGGSGAAGSGMTQSEPSASVTKGSALQQVECPTGEASASAGQDDAISGSASADATPRGRDYWGWPPEVLGDTTIGGADTQDDATASAASQEDLAIGGSPSQDANTGGAASQEDLAIGGSASQNANTGGAASQNANTGGSASQNDVQGGAASEEDLAIGGSPSEDAAVEGTGTGSADGGGG